MHDWGDEDFDWAGLNKAGRMITDICRRYARLGGQSKEKYGTLRFYAAFGWLSLHSLFYPGYAGSQFPNWLWRLDCRIIGPVLRKLFEKVFVCWQIKVYIYAYQKAVKKYPHLRVEILVMADQLELIPDTEDIQARWTKA